MSKLRSDELVNMEGDGAPSFPQGATTIEPTTDNQVATKLYVDSTLSAASGNAVSSTAPINPAIGSFWTDTSVNPSLLKTWNGNVWIEFAGTASAAVGVVVSLPSLSASNLEYAPATITASAAQVSNATLFTAKWYKDDVEIVGATGLTYVATEPGVYRYEERWADDAGNVLTPSLNKTIELLSIQSPSIISPAAGSGFPDFDYTAESSAIANIGSVDVLDGSAFGTAYWSGNSVMNRPITTGIDNTGDSLIWVKNRDSSGYVHVLTGQHILNGGFTNSNSASITNIWTNNSAMGDQSTNYITGVLDDGFTIGNSGHVNDPGENYVGWNFLKTSGFLDIVTFNGDGVTGRAVPHNLGTAPGFIMLKNLTLNENWMCYHKEAALDGYLAAHERFLQINNTSAAFPPNSAGSASSAWGNTAPDENNFYLGGSVNSNSSGSDFVAYLFADNPSNGIKCGTYTGTDYSGPVQVDCGFRAKWVMIKSTVNSDRWRIYWDGSSTPGSTSLAPNTHDAEDGGGGVSHVSFTNSGFTVEDSAGYSPNWADKFVFVAIGTPQATVSQPQLTLTDTTVSKVSDGSLVGGSTIDQVLTVGETVQADTAVTATVSASVFSTNLWDGNSGSQTINTGIDLSNGSGMVWIKNRTSAWEPMIFDTELGPERYSITSGTQTYNRSNSGSGDNDTLSSFNSDGFDIGPMAAVNQTGEDYVSWTFRKAPGFFDIVNYTGDGSNNQEFSHSLGSMPGMVIIKNLTRNADWFVWVDDGISTLEGTLNNYDDFPTAGYNVIGSVTSTTVQTLHSNQTATNRTGDDYVAYIFAKDTPGVIKCGLYNGNGSNSQTVDLGFRPGWLLTKPINLAQGWMILDSERLTNSGTHNAFLQPNENQTENASNQFHSFTDTGFTAGDSANANNRQTLYVAIAENPTVDITGEIYATGTVASSSGNTITLSNTSGTWSTGMKVRGTDSDTVDNPDPINASAVTFTSSQPVVTNGTVNTWDYAEWNLSHDSAFSGVVHQKAVPLTGTGTQAGPDDFTIQAGTEYFVRTKYASSLPAGQSNWSAVTRFLTKANTYVDDLFAVNLYRNDSNTESFNNGLDMSGEGGLIITKFRDTSTDWAWVDSERSVNKVLKSNNQNPESDESWIQSFDDDGFTHGNYIGTGNDSGVVSWSFRKQPGFFDIVTYTGDSTTPRDIPHNLGSTPGMIIIKKVTENSNWICYHRSMGAQNVLYLNTNDVQVDADWAFADTAPTSTHFTVHSDGWVNSNGHTYVAYLFAHDEANFGTNEDESIIKCGMYTGNGGSKDVEIGFEPQWVLIKNVDEHQSWSAFDNLRGAAQWNSNSFRLRPNNTGGDDISGIGFYSNGISLLNGSAEVNRSGKNFVYVAIRRPHKPVTVATDVFDMDTGSSSTTTPTWDSGFPVDASIIFHTTNNMNKFISARLLGSKYINTNDASAEAVDGSQTWDSNVGWGKDYNSNAYSYMFRRAPGFMDVVTYKGTGSVMTVNHNLGAVPELILVKSTDTTHPWYVYNATSGNTKLLELSTNQPAYTASWTWNNTTPTSTQFTVGDSAAVVGANDPHVAYLFASLDGISKVGSYTGTGGNIDVDCGFAAGARFILIKRTDTNGDWYFWDTLRGITSGNDPYSLLNTYDAQVTSTDYIDPLDAGFTVTSSAPAGVNANGGEYMFLAIA